MLHLSTGQVQFQKCCDVALNTVHGAGSSKLALLNAATRLIPSEPSTSSEPLNSTEMNFVLICMTLANRFKSHLRQDGGFVAGTFKT
jgi:hypothetical protein